MRLSSQRAIILAFCFITLIIILLGIVSLFSMQTSSRAIDNVLAKNRYVQFAKEGTTNLARAGQLPKEIETCVQDLAPLRDKMQNLQAEFDLIKTKFAGNSLAPAGRKIVADFLKNGEEFYQALARFFPLKEEMALHTTEYKGETIALVNLLSQRELEHVRYVRALRRSVAQGKMLVGTLDYKSCGFFNWYQETPIKHPVIAEILLEEMNPLHISLHNSAAGVARFLADNQIDMARATLAQADDDLVRLGNYFTGLRNLAYEEHALAQGAFRKQIDALQEIYAQTVDTANRLETYLFTIDLEPALDGLEDTTDKNKALTWIFSILGVALSIAVGFTTYFKVRNRTLQLVKLTEKLEITKNEIEENRNQLQHAFDEVSFLIQEVSHAQQFDIRFHNPSLNKCYEMMNCQQTACCCYAEEAIRCWQVQGTLCHGEMQNGFTNKFERCVKCPVFQHATTDPVFLIGELFNNMMAMLEAKSKEIEELSITDQLTALYNRRGFLSLGERQLNLTRRIKGDILLLFADLDNMKGINDSLGHKTGDLALVETADILRQTFRDTDIIGRLGGDEFAVLFTCETTDHKECEDTILQRLWSNLDECNSQPNREYQMAISIGLAWFDHDNPVPIYNLMTEADALMYEEKKQKKQARDSIDVRG